MCDSINGMNAAGSGMYSSSLARWTNGPIKGVCQNLPNISFDQILLSIHDLQSLLSSQPAPQYLAFDSAAKLVNSALGTENAMRPLAAPEDRLSGVLLSEWCY